MGNNSFAQPASLDEVIINVSIDESASIGEVNLYYGVGLTGLFEKPVDSVSGELDDVKTEDLSEGFTILNTKKGKIIIEKIGETIRVRDDLIV